MSTRGVLGYRQHGKDFLFYNHQDSYPENLGRRVCAMVAAGNTEPTEPTEEEDGTDFVGDSVFCQFGYVMNNDDQVMEFYKGINTNPDAPGRYTKTGSWVDPDEKKEYFGIRLVKNIPYEIIRSTPEEGWMQLFKED